MDSTIVVNDACRADRFLFRPALTQTQLTSAPVEREYQRPTESHRKTGNFTLFAAI